jgi:hypothetical protein
MGGGPRVCGAGPDTEGGDARRPCHGHAAGIRRLQRGLVLGSAGGRGAGEKRRARVGGCAGCRGAERRVGWRLTRGCGAAAGKRGKEERAVGGSCRGAAANDNAGRSEPGEGAARGRGKLTGGTRPSAAPAERRRGVETDRDGGLGRFACGEEREEGEVQLGLVAWAGGLAAH